MTTKHTRLAAMFSALLVGCSDRDIPGAEDSAGSTAGATDSSTGDDPTTTANPTTANPTTETSTTANPTTATSETTEPPDPSSPGTDPTFDTSENECVYADHIINLTAEEYEKWLNGEATAGTDTIGETGTASDTDVDTGSTTTASDGTAGTTTASDTGGTTSAEEGWSFELCVEICVALAGALEWNILTCEQTAVDPEGNVEIKCVEILQHCDGRSHACITSRGAVADEDPVAAHLARAAHDEAASVHAFAALHAELLAFGAPAELLARIQLAAADEVRHAAAVAALASNHGAACRRPTRTDIPARTLHAIAVENAVEGCVRETWAALLAAHQATYAADPQIRHVMQVIAADEARHAELAWAIDAWLRTVLDEATWATVEAARTAAAASVIAGVTTTTPAPSLVTTAGLPDRPRATRLVHGLAAALWPAAA